MADLLQFYVADVLYKLAESENINIAITGIDDLCYGMVIAADKSFRDVCTQHMGVYNFQIVDGDPIKLIRRTLDDLTIDVNIDQTECLVRRDGPAVQLKRIDVARLPRQIEVQYIDPDRQFAATTQVAKHMGAPLSNVTMSAAIDFVISADQARQLAFDLLYRVWGQQLMVQFEHRNIAIEPGDVVLLTCDQGNLTLLVTESTYTTSRTNLITATVLLTQPAPPVL